MQKVHFAYYLRGVRSCMIIYELCANFQVKVGHGRKHHGEVSMLFLHPERQFRRKNRRT